MKICLELHSETLAEFRAELETFLAPSATAAAAASASTNTTMVVATGPAIVGPLIDPASTGTIEVHSDTTDTVVAAPSAADVALGPIPADTVTRSTLPMAPKGERARTAADIALGLDPEAAVVTTAADTVRPDTATTWQPDIEDLLADKAQLQFDYDRVLALQGRAAALGIVRGVLPPGQQTKLKDIETLPVELIPAAIAALQAAGAN